MNNINYKSCFDIIGPVMIGPSSSHTAGALAIGRAARKLFMGTPQKIVIKYYESLAETHKGHGTDFAIIGGILGFSSNDPNIIKSLEIAKAKCIDYKFIEMSEDSPFHHANTACITLSDDKHEIHLTGISVGGGIIEVRHIEIDSFFVSLYGSLPILLAITSEEDIIQEFKGILKEHNVIVNSISRYVKNNKILFIFDLEAELPSLVKNKLIARDSKTKVIFL
ncbi:L-serine ammonia-lyase, iron-sulfur-dependent, subunit beta [Enterococcus mundtii]|uniref:L-serine ammonia-lyase, iron-sulfur-dependent subunit beta n=1 Tax=Enterococcus mundtii TaxID=53346 RepID=UPI0018848786|nr:L-serine ammonia-lyase, iron-sulfur-dependent subunit beta [Enterococcus mundtii]MBE9912055.1 L-serine ammonia-lyase, iron-sulfur-dependent, subunit beta [Enterococcus mundtii]